MPTDLSPPARDRFGFKAAAIVGSVAAGAWLTSFIVVPVLEGRAQGLSAFAAICRAVGLYTPAQQDVATGPVASSLAWTTATLGDLAGGDAAAGAKLAEDVCHVCHAANGLVSQPLTPSMTGQSSRAIYKQLLDFKSGARVSATMGPIVAELTPRQMVDVAAYYGLKPRRNHDIRVGPSDDVSAVRLATQGDAARALPACDSCHGLRSGGPLEAPMLVGQYPDYFSAQLRTYIDGSRRNDLYARMRTIAAKLTDKEVEGLAAYYNAPP